MALPEHTSEKKTGPVNQKSSSVLLWVFLVLVIALFIGVLVVRPALQMNSGPNRSTPAAPAGK